MTDDLISRADAIEAIEELPNAYNGWSDAYDKAYIIGTLEEVPSAQPKQGEWRKCKDGTLYCSECGNTAPYKEDYYGYVTEAPRYDFCPNCGARMTDSEKPNNCKDEPSKDFTEFLFNVIPPNDMEDYMSIWKSQGIKECKE